MSEPLILPGYLGLRLLAIGVDGFWKPWIEGARTQDDPEIEFVPTCRQALRRLVSASPPFSHVLLQSSHSPDQIAELLSLTSGDAGSPTRLLVLGQFNRPPVVGMRGTCITVSDDQAPRLGDILHQEARRFQAAGPIDFSATDLLSLIASDALEIRYQPIVRLEDRRPMACEALARIYHPVHGMLSAHQFVPLAEKLGFSPALTQTIGGQIMRDMAASILGNVLITGINFSLDVMLIDGTLDILDAQRQAAGIAVEQVMIELTESRPAQDFPALRKALDRLRRAGYGVALDDAAPSVPHLRELLDLPFTAVKLDKSIIHYSQPSDRTATYISRLIDACKSRNFLVIAEGAEREEDLLRMKAMGADWAQGYRIARPLPASALPIWREAWNYR